MPISQERADAVISKENEAIANAQREATMNYLQNRVVLLGAENEDLRDLLKEHAPEALEEYDKPPTPPPTQPQDHLPPQEKPTRKPRKPRQAASAASDSEAESQDEQVPDQG